MSALRIAGVRSTLLDLLHLALCRLAFASHSFVARKICQWVLVVPDMLTRVHCVCDDPPCSVDDVQFVVESMFALEPWCRSFYRPFAFRIAEASTEDGEGTGKEQVGCAAGAVFGSCWALDFSHWRAL